MENIADKLSFVVYMILMPAGLVYCFYYVLIKKRKGWVDRQLDDVPESAMLSRATMEFWTRLVSPIENFFVRFNIHPNTIGYCSLTLSILACILLSSGSFLWGGWAVIFAGTFDFFDGRVARRLNLVSRKGEYFDSNIDRICEAFWYLGLFNYYANTLFFYVVFIAFVSSMLVSYAKARGESMGISGRVGAMQRPARVVWLGVPAIFSPLFATVIGNFMPVSESFLASFGITVLAVMTSITYIQRYRFVLGKL